MKNPPNRPPRVPGVKSLNRVSVPLTDAELWAWRAQANRAGGNLSEFIRQAVAAAIERNS